MAQTLCSNGSILICAAVFCNAFAYTPAVISASQKSFGIMDKGQNVLIANVWMKRPINSFGNWSAFWRLGGSFQVSGVLWMLLGWLHICCFLVFVLTRIVLRLFCVGFQNSPIQGCLHYCRCGLGKHSQLASLRLESVYRSMLMLREAQKSQKDRSSYHSSKSRWGSWGNVKSWDTGYCTI